MPKEIPKPTEAELDILQILWTKGPSTVRAVHALVGRKTGYTSTLKLMQIMFEKGLLARTQEGRLHVYRPCQPASHIQRRLAGDLIDRAFGGSARKLIVAALSSRRATPEELSEIRKMLESPEGDAL